MEWRHKGEVPAWQAAATLTLVLLNIIIQRLLWLCEWGELPSEQEQPHAQDSIICTHTHTPTRRLLLRVVIERLVWSRMRDSSTHLTVAGRVTCPHMLHMEVRPRPQCMPRPQPLRVTVTVCVISNRQVTKSVLNAHTTSTREVVTVNGYTAGS